jgi:Flp pilus assembly protein CpaB
MTPAPPTQKPVLSLSSLLLLLVLITGVLEGLVLWLREDSRSVQLAVPQYDLPAYHQIQLGDLTEQIFDATIVATDTLVMASAISGRYTLTAVVAGQPLRDAFLGPMVDTTSISGTVALGIPATAAMVLGGTLRAGDVIDIMVVPAITPTSTPIIPLVLENILVLDIKPQVIATTGNKLQSDAPWIVIVALPLDQRSNFIVWSVSGTVFLMHRASSSSPFADSESQFVKLPPPAGQNRPSGR